MSPHKLHFNYPVAFKILTTTIIIIVVHSFGMTVKPSIKIVT